MSQQRKKGSKGKVSAQSRDSEKRQIRRFLFVWLPVIIGFLLFFYVMVLDPPRPVGQPIPGTSRSGEQARLGESTGKADMVVLDDGRTVAIEGSLMVFPDAGRRVLVQENKTLIFKRKYFSFVRYLE